MTNKIQEVKNEVGKVVSGKDEIIEVVLEAILAGGHILIEDIPGVGKTTLALSLSKSLGLTFNRVQFTPDVVPSDITGFAIYDKETGTLRYHEGAVITNFFLADEINRTSSKTQSALLEVMQEEKVTVDGEAHFVPQPFVVVATQNPVGTAGTQMLPEAQLDRFMIKTSMGYPDSDAQLEILKRREKDNPLDYTKSILTAAELVKIKEIVRQIFTDDKIYRYITQLCEATRNHEYVKLGASPRGAIALANMSRSRAFIQGRDYVVPEDVKDVFLCTLRHRLILQAKASLNNIKADDILSEIISSISAPKID